MIKLKYISTILCLVYASLNFVYASGTSGEVRPIKTLVDLGLSKKCDIEPIFNGKACIYEINPDAKETIVFIHGLNANAARWYEQIAAVKDKYHVISFDLPGFGASTHGNKLYSPTNYAYFVNYIKKKHIKEPFYLVGHSMGGAIALRYSAMYPNDIKRLILADVGGVLHQYSFAKSVAFKWLKYVKDITYWALPSLQEIPSMHELANMFFQSLDWLPVDIRDALKVPELREIILQGNSVSIAGAAVSSEDFSGTIRGNKIPTLIVWGEYDLVTPIRTGDLLQARMSNAYLKILPRAAHSAMNDQPTMFNQLMLAHFTAADSEIQNKGWKFRDFKLSKRIGRCSNEYEKHFEGDYLRIELTNCKRAVMQNVNVGSIVAKNSDVYINKSQIKTKDIGIMLFDSTLELSSSNITAQVGIQTIRSHIDIAGVDFNIGHAAVNNLGNSDAVFSVCLVNDKPLHRYKDFTIAGRI